MAKQPIRTELQCLEDEWNATKQISYASATKDTFMNNIWEKQRIHKKEAKLLKPEIQELRRKIESKDLQIQELKLELNKVLKENKSLNEALEGQTKQFYGSATSEQIKAATVEPTND